MFHAYCDAGLWDEADAAFVALDNPKHRFLAPALERDLLLRFFPGGDWRRPPTVARLQPISEFGDLPGNARPVRRRPGRLPRAGRRPARRRPDRAGPAGAAAGPAARCRTRGRTCGGPTAATPSASPAAWTRRSTLARSLVPVDVYEWVHVFECLLRAGRLYGARHQERPVPAAARRGTPLGGAGPPADAGRLPARDGGADAGAGSGVSGSAGGV